jgi:hypothetical protein
LRRKRKEDDFSAKLYAKGALRLLPLLLFPFQAQFASTTDFHISHDGHDGNTGATGSPGLAIQKAAETVPAGSNVIVHEGVYQKKSQRRGIRERWCRINHLLGCTG